MYDNKTQMTCFVHIILFFTGLTKLCVFFLVLFKGKNELLHYIPKAIGTHWIFVQTGSYRPNLQCGVVIVPNIIYNWYT